MEIVSTKSAPDAIGPYSQAVTVNGFVFTSGQIGIDPRSGQIEETGIEGQARQAILNLASILEAAGSGLEKAVKQRASFKTWRISPRSTKYMPGFSPTGRREAALKSPRCPRVRWWK